MNPVVDPPALDDLLEEPTHYWVEPSNSSAEPLVEPTCGEFVLSGVEGFVLRGACPEPLRRVEAPAEPALPFDSLCGIIA